MDIRIMSNNTYYNRKAGTYQTKPWTITKARGTNGTPMVAFWMEYPGQDPWKPVYCDDPIVVRLLEQLMDCSNDPNIPDSEVKIVGEDIKTRINSLVAPYITGAKVAQRQVFTRAPRKQGQTINSTTNFTASNVTVDTTADTIVEEVPEIVEEPQPQLDSKIIKQLRNNCGKFLFNFMKDFHMDASRRLANTLGYLVKISDKEAKDYLYSYVNLIDNGYEDAVREKVKNDEFNQFLAELKQIPNKPRINTRLEIYYGPAGAGKTYDATHAPNYAGCIVCAADKYPSDLFRDYDPNNGSPIYRKNCLYNALISGGTIVLDEINLLQMGTLQFLQGILDGKEEIDLFGEKVKIHPDFKIIGTMNLIVGGAKLPLPEPLVDRCANIVEYQTSGMALGDSI